MRAVNYSIIIVIFLQLCSAHFFTGRLKVFLFQGANSTAAGHYKGFQCSIASYLVHTVAEPTHYIRWVSNIAHVNMGYHTIFQNWYNIKRLYY